MSEGYLGVQAAGIVRSVLVMLRFFFSQTAMAGAPTGLKVSNLCCASAMPDGT
jgi:hypothetical protein